MLKKPKFLKNITPRMMIIWAISFTAFLLVAFGTATITMVAIPKTYGASVDLDNNVFTIRYMNEHTNANPSFQRHGRPLLAVDDAHYGAMQEIMRLLESGGKTNALSNLFRGNPKQVVENTNMQAGHTSTFENSFATNAIVIEFGRPQHSVEPISRTTFRLMAAGEGERDIFSIMIPLDNISNRFQPQTWYLVSQNRRGMSSGSLLDISCKISTYGNYSKLWEFVNGLNVP